MYEVGSKFSWTEHVLANLFVTFGWNPSCLTTKVEEFIETASYDTLKPFRIVRSGELTSLLRNAQCVVPPVLHVNLPFAGEVNLPLR